MNRRTVAVIGAGVVGVSTAYALAKQDWDVVLVDARAEPGEGVSAGNAAQLSYAFGDAMASPALLRHLPAVVAGKDPAFRVSWPLDPDFLAWGIRFLLNGSGRRWWANTAQILDLAEESRIGMAELGREVELAFSYRVAGKLHLHPNKASLAKAAPTVERKQARGLVQTILSRAEATAIEPALAAYQADIAGAVYTPDDAVGDATAFCREMTGHLVRHYGVTTLFGREVVGIAKHQGRVCALRFRDRDDLPVVHAVVASGPTVTSLARDVPESRAIWPVRGYSLTLPASPDAPSVSLTDVARKLAFARIGDRFRVAGLADIEPRGAGFDTTRFKVLDDAARRVFPTLFSTSGVGTRWSGQRPMTPSSQPIIMRSRHIEGLFLNIGHGMLGWTLALGSARRLAAMMTQDP